MNSSLINKSLKLLLKHNMLNGEEIVGQMAREGGPRCEVNHCLIFEG